MTALWTGCYLVFVSFQALALSPGGKARIAWDTKAPQLIYRVDDNVIVQTALGNGTYSRQLRTEGIVQTEAIVFCKGNSVKPTVGCSYYGPSDMGQVYLNNTWTPLERALKTAPKSLALLGFGAIVPDSVMRKYPHAKITAVDYDQSAVDVAVQFFGFPKLQPVKTAIGDPEGSGRSCSGNFCLVTADARDFVKSQIPRAFDAVVVDLFDSSGSPPDFLNDEAFLKNLDKITRFGVIFNEDEATLKKGLQLDLLRKHFGHVEERRFGRKDLEILRRDICPCRQPGDDCGCGEENRFVVALKQSGCTGKKCNVLRHH